MSIHLFHKSLTYERDNIVMQTRTNERNNIVKNISNPRSTPPLSVEIYIQDAIVCKIYFYIQTKSKDASGTIEEKKHTHTFLRLAHYEQTTTEKKIEKKIPIHVVPIYAILPLL